MQDDMKSVQEEIKLISCRGESASGAIKIDLNGDYKVTNIELDNSLLSDKEILGDLIMMAINDASSQVSTKSKEKMKNVTGGLNLPF
jgi:DNA-binding YbaB/EbfC family protein